MRGEACERRWQLNDEDALARSAPEVSASIVGGIGYTVGAEAVGIGDGVERAVVVGGDDDAGIFFDNSLQMIAQLNGLHDVAFDDFLMAILQCANIHDVEHSGFERFLGNFLIDGHLVVFHPIDDAVVG